VHVKPGAIARKTCADKHNRRVAALSPFWELAKFCGVRWVITVERNGHQVGRELVRGWRNSKRRINEIALDVTTGPRGGQFTI
jgi:hypothetical protein